MSSGWEQKGCFKKSPFSFTGAESMFARFPPVFSNHATCANRCLAESRDAV